MKISFLTMLQLLCTIMFLGSLYWLPGCSASTAAIPKTAYQSPAKAHEAIGRGTEVVSADGTVIRQEVASAAGVDRPVAQLSAIDGRAVHIIATAASIDATNTAALEMAVENEKAAKAAALQIASLTNQVTDLTAKVKEAEASKGGLTLGLMVIAGVLALAAGAALFFFGYVKGGIALAVSGLCLAGAASAFQMWRVQISLAILGLAVAGAVFLIVMNWTTIKQLFKSTGAMKAMVPASSQDAASAKLNDIQHPWTKSLVLDMKAAALKVETLLQAKKLDAGIPPSVSAPDPVPAAPAVELMPVPVASPVAPAAPAPMEMP